MILKENLFYVCLSLSSDYRQVEFSDYKYSFKFNTPSSVVVQQYLCFRKIGRIKIDESDNIHIKSL